MLNKLITSFVILLSCYPKISIAQSPPDSCITKTFQKELIITTLPYNDIHYALATKDSGIMITGNSISHLTYPSNGEPFYDSSFLTKMDKKGDVVWSKILTGFPDGTTNKLVELEDSSLILLHPFNDLNNFSLSKISKDGGVLWKKDFDDIMPGHFSSLYDLVLTGDKKLIGAGWSDDGFLVTKFDTSGNIIWAKVYDINLPFAGFGILNSNIKVIREVTDGFIIMSYSLVVNPNTDSPIHLYKIDKTTGEIIWTKSIAIPNGYFYTNGLLEYDNGIILFAQLRDRITHQKNLAIIKIDNGFNLITAIKMNGIYSSHAFLKTSDNKILLATTDTSASTTAPYLMYQLDMDLNIEWAKKYFIPVDSTSLRLTRPILAETKDKGLVTFLKRRNAVNSRTYLHMVKTDQTGNAGDCANMNIRLNASLFFPAVTNFPSTAYDKMYLQVAGNLVLTPNNITTNTICERDTYCDSIQLAGRDSVCNLSDSAEFSIRRNAGCFTTPVWQLADTSYGVVVVKSDTTIKIKFRKPGTVRLKVTLPSACETLQDSMLIHINRPADSLNIGPDIRFCGDTLVRLNAGKDYKSYLWQDNSTDSILIANGPGIYHLTVTDYCNRSHSDSLIIIENLPERIDLGPDRFICLGDSTTLSAPAGFVNYQWSPTNNLISNNATAIAFPPTTTKYVAMAERSPGCISTDSVWVYVFNTFSINLGVDTSFCNGAGKILDAGPGFTGYLWSTGAGTRQITATTAGQYSVIATDPNGCKAKDTLSVLSVYPLPAVDLSNDTTLCSGDSRILDAGSGSISYLWQDGSTGQTFNARDTGTYWVKVTSANSCSAGDTARIIIINTAPADFIIPDTSLCRGTTLILQPTQPLNSYLWSTGATANNITISTAGTYWLEATNAAGCKAKEFTLVTIKDCVNRINFPNAFTPNNDGLNDLFRPIITGPMIQYSLVVYNRYGEKVFFTTDYQQGWDGTVKGIKQNTGAFTWYSHWQFLNEQTASQKGTVTVIR